MYYALYHVRITYSIIHTRDIYSSTYCIARPSSIHSTPPPCMLIHNAWIYNDDDALLLVPSCVILLRHIALFLMIDIFSALLSYPAGAGSSPSQCVLSSFPETSLYCVHLSEHRCAILPRRRACKHTVLYSKVFSSRYIRISSKCETNAWVTSIEPRPSLYEGGAAL